MIDGEIAGESGGFQLVGDGFGAFLCFWSVRRSPGLCSRRSGVRLMVLMFASKFSNRIIGRIRFCSGGK